jgi:molecular chaperone GrpE
MDEESKQSLLQRFRQYLDRVDEHPHHTDEESGREVDLYTLFTELASLKSEIKIESRQLKRALDQSRELIDAVQQTNERLGSELSELRSAENALREEAEQELLLEVLELRDRIEAGAGSIEKYKPGGMLERPRGRVKKMLDGIGEGMEISLRRIDGLLSRYKVSQITAIGQRLDPMCMRAASTGFDAQQDDGIILNEIRKGYRRGGKVLRLAEVVVNKQELHT